MTDDLDSDFAALADEARRLEARVVGVSTRITEEFKTVRMIDMADAIREVRACVLAQPIKGLP